MSIYEKYRSKLISVEEALSMVNTGDEIVASFCATEPMALLGGLHTIKDRVENVSIWTSLTLKEYDFFASPDMKGHFETNAWFLGPGTRKGYHTGLVSYQPAHLHSAFKRKADISVPRIFWGSCSSIDQHGYVHSSLSMLYEKFFATRAEIVIFEVNKNMPLVYGDSEFFIDDIDYFIEVDREIPQVPSIDITSVEATIGGYVASLVNDGDTIQLGIGGIPNAVTNAFMDKRELGMHTEMLSSSVVDLVEAGVITGSRKSLHRGKTVCTFIYGDKRLYDFVDKNTSVSIMQGEYVNSPSVVAKNDNMVAINTAIEVDLTGQICSENIGYRSYSGTGGQNDMSVGAVHARNGRSIICLPSTAKNGSISTINPSPTPGSVVTLSRNDVDYIITEYGIAPIKGRTIRQRVENIIGIAHPDFRGELRKTALKNNLI